MTSNANTALAELRDGPLYRFADWPNPAVPNDRIGVYTIWHGDQLIYVGMAGTGIGPDTDASTPVPAKRTGLRSRLASHASGRRSGDQFCVYVFDRPVLPKLSRQQIQDAAQGQLSLDSLTRKHIRQSFSYRFTLLGDVTAARAVEREIQQTTTCLASLDSRLSSSRLPHQGRSFQAVARDGYTALDPAATYYRSAPARKTEHSGRS